MRGPGFDPHRQIQSSLVGHTCHLSTLEVGAEGSGVQGHPWLHGQFKDSLECMRPMVTCGLCVLEPTTWRRDQTRASCPLTFICGCGMHAPTKQINVRSISRQKDRRDKWGTDCPRPQHQDSKPRPDPGPWYHSFQPAFYGPCLWHVFKSLTEFLTSHFTDEETKAQGEARMCL